MQRIICVLVVLAASPLVAADADDDVKKELKALEGTWKAVALEAGGKPFRHPSSSSVYRRARRQGTGRMGKIEYQATVIDPNKNPRPSTTHETGAKGKKQFGIYKVEEASGSSADCPGARRVIVPSPSIRRAHVRRSSSSGRRTRSREGERNLAAVRTSLRFELVLDLASTAHSSSIPVEEHEIHGDLTER